MKQRRCVSRAHLRGAGEEGRDGEGGKTEQKERGAQLRGIEKMRVKQERGLRKEGTSMMGRDGKKEEREGRGGGREK